MLEENDSSGPVKYRVPKHGTRPVRRPTVVAASVRVYAPRGTLSNSASCNAQSPMLATGFSYTGSPTLRTRHYRKPTHSTTGGRYTPNGTITGVSYTDGLLKCPERLGSSAANCTKPSCTKENNTDVVLQGGGE